MGFGILFWRSFPLRHVDRQCQWLFDPGGVIWLGHGSHVTDSTETSHYRVLGIPDNFLDLWLGNLHALGKGRVVPGDHQYCQQRGIRIAGCLDRLQHGSLAALTLVELVDRSTFLNSTTTGS